jgi:ABC-type transport system involved in cytochrome bd biosynthesis fused ATPase/permease subunit
MKVQLDNTTVRHPAARAGAPAALHGLDLVVAQGEQVAVIGPSGAGKTTLLQLLACAQRPDQGSLQLDGRPLGIAAPRSCSACAVAFFWRPRCRRCHPGSVW